MVLLHHLYSSTLKDLNSNTRNVSMQHPVCLFFPYPWVIGLERTGSWFHQKLLVGDPILPGAVAKDNVGCLKAFRLPMLKSFLPSLWVSPCWTKEEDETIMSYISPSSFTLFQYQWCFSKNLCQSHGLYALLWSIHNPWVIHFPLHPNQRNGSLLSIFCTSKACQIPWHCSQTWRWYEHWICFYRWWMSRSHGPQEACRDVLSSSRYSMILCLSPCWVLSPSEEKKMGPALISWLKFLFPGEENMVTRISVFL